MRQTELHMSWEFQSKKLPWWNNLFGEDESRRYIGNYFIRFVALAFVLGFLTVWKQILPLMDSELLEVQPFLQGTLNSWDELAYLLHPTWFWFSTKPWMYQLVAGLGLLCSLLVFFGWTQKLFVFFMWSCFLSFAVISRGALGTDQDLFLLEIGFLAVFLYRYSPLRVPRTAPRYSVLILLKIVLIKILWMKAFDHIWSNGSLNIHDLRTWTLFWQNQIHPTNFVFYMLRSGEWLQKFICFFFVATELLLPIWIFAPARLRKITSFWGTAYIALDGLFLGFTSFHILFFALLLLVVEDDMLPYLLRRSQFIAWKMNPKRFFNYDLVAMSLFFLLTPENLILSINKAETAHAASTMQAKVEAPPSIFSYYYKRLLEGLKLTATYGQASHSLPFHYQIQIEHSKDGSNWESLRGPWTLNDSTIENMIPFRSRSIAAEILRKEVTAISFERTEDDSFAWTRDILTDLSLNRKSGWIAQYALDPVPNEAAMFRARIERCKIAGDVKTQSWDCGETDLVLLRPPMGEDVL